MCVGGGRELKHYHRITHEDGHGDDPRLYTDVSPMLKASGVLSPGWPLHCVIMRDTELEHLKNYSPKSWSLALWEIAFEISGTPETVHGGTQTIWAFDLHIFIGADYHLRPSLMLLVRRFTVATGVPPHSTQTGHRHGMWRGSFERGTIRVEIPEVSLIEAKSMDKTGASLNF